MCEPWAVSSHAPHHRRASFLPWLSAPMSLLRSLRTRLANRIAPEATPDPASRRDFFRTAAGVGAAAVGGSMLLTDEAAARAERFGIAPGTVVDAQGRPASGGGTLEPFIAQIILFAGNFPPRGWAFCDGQLLPINQFQALFSLVGTSYGGDGRTTFALPDLRGRSPIGPRTGPGFATYREGQKGGTENVFLNTANLPSHNHPATVAIGRSSSPGTTADPAGAVPAVPASSIPQYVPDASADATLNEPVTVGNAGGSQPFSNRDPYLAINYIIALQGVFPSRN